MRVEVYIPPYLTDGRTQPSFTVDEQDWQYGGSYTIHVTLHQGTTSTMKVSLIAGTLSKSIAGNYATHTGPASSQRLLARFAVFSSLSLHRS